MAFPAPSQPALANTHWQQQAAGAAQVPRGRSMAAAKVPTAPVPPNMLALHGTAVAAPAGGPQTMAIAAPSMPVSLASPAVPGLTPLHLTRHLHLPSGLEAVSSAVMLDRALAVDSEGAVFLSRDIGKHWETVPVQWAGKAMQVAAPPRALERLKSDADLEEAVSGAPEEPALVESTSQRISGSAPPASVTPPVPAPLPANAEAARTAPAMLFKLVNDRHQTWVSVDGKVWRPQ